MDEEPRLEELGVMTGEVGREPDWVGWGVKEPKERGEGVSAGYEQRGPKEC